MLENRIYGIGGDGHFVDSKNIECADDQEATNRPSERLSDLLTLSYEPMLAWRLDGSIEFWNAGAERLYGFAPDEAVGRSSHSVANQISDRINRAAFTPSEQALLVRRAATYLQGWPRSHCGQPDAVARR
jgi:PAS domain-containing protein